VSFTSRVVFLAVPISGHHIVQFMHNFMHFCCVQSLLCTSLNCECCLADIASRHVAFQCILFSTGNMYKVLTCMSRVVSQWAKNQ
jgi:hypothetical protein